MPSQSQQAKQLAKQQAKAAKRKRQREEKGDDGSTEKRIAIDRPHLLSKYMSWLRLAHATYEPVPGGYLESGCGSFVPPARKEKWDTDHVYTLSRVSGPSECTMHDRTEARMQESNASRRATHYSVQQLAEDQ